MSKKTKNRKFHILPKSTGLSIAFFLLLILEMVFIFLIGAIDVLPGGFLGIIVGLIVLLDVPVILLMASRKPKSLKPMIGLIVAIVLFMIMAAGTYFLLNTYDTLYKITKYDEQFEEYDVIVAADSQYAEIGEISGKTVYVSQTRSKMYTEAQEKLLTEVDITYEEVSDAGKTMNKILDRKGKIHDNIVFISKGSYDLLCEDNEKLENSTRVLYTISVPIKSNDSINSVNVTEDPFNIYITGIDTWGSIEKVSRSDVNMLVTVNPQTKTILLTSIPRDSYVMMHSYGSYDKLTHTGIYGVDETVQTVEDMLDMDINYYARVNFSMLIDLVNAIGGIDVVSDYAFQSAVSECTYVKGENHLTGRQALYFARERKAFAEKGDEQRVKNQQIVMKAIIQKVTSSKVILTKYTDILNAVEGEMQISMSGKDITSLVKMQMKDMSGWDIKTVSISGATGMASTYSMGSTPLSVLYPSEETVAKAKEKIHEVMYPPTTKEDVLGDYEVK